MHMSYLAFLEVTPFATFEQIITEQEKEIQRIQDEIKHLKNELDSPPPGQQGEPKEASKVE